MPLTQQEKSTDIVVKLSKEGKEIDSLVFPYWFTQSVQITAVVNAVVKSGETYRSVNTHDVVAFTINWMNCESHDFISLLDIDISWKVWEDEK